MLSRIDKGKRLEREFAKFLLERGYLTDVWVVPSVRWGKKDLFGLFDIVGITKHGFLFFAQVKKNKAHVSSAWKKIKAWMADKPFRHVAIFVVATKQDGRWVLKTSGGSWFNMLLENFDAEPLKGDYAALQI